MSSGNSGICATEFCRKSCSAAAASVLSIICTTPFEVIKTRMQAQAAAGSVMISPQRFILSTCPNVCHTGICGQPRLAALCPPECYVYISTLDAFRKILNQEGVRGLWRGTRESFLIAVPMVGLYLPLYDTFVERMSGLGLAAPVVAGSLARTIANFVVAPLEILRTRVQAVQQFALSGSVTSLNEFDWGQGRSYRQKVRTLWRGYGATVARDVPFTAVYWGLLEPIRKKLLIQNDRDLKNVIFANSIAGAAAGVFAAAITTPMDVVKTRTQIAQSKGNSVPRIRDVLKTVYRTEGITGLFSGIAPRTIRVAPSCAIVLSTYEIFKRIL
eukprot:g9079.t1